MDILLQGTAKSVGFIRFDQRSEAEMAISKLNGTIPKGEQNFHKSTSENFSDETKFLSRSGFTEPINVKFANTPNGAKAMMGLPLAPSYLTGLTNSQQPVIATVPSLRPTLNRYRYAAQNRS